MPDYLASPSNSEDEDIEETVYIVSVDVLMKARQLVNPRKKNHVTLTLEKFNIKDQEWVTVKNPLDLVVETDNFSSGGFRNAFLRVSKDKDKWVIKTYNDKATDTITGTEESIVEDHTCKQIQMHCAAI
ncbi:Hypothetical predicted protein [Paramuricea clavata]|uniref:Uncharacterized protein n=1 Tax=Paramuricea clavata TaxID=317549 RepID=A0A6S7HF04_PARCT|nr:Hypothetical predicted protein [Paramuricea clavata]